MNAITSGMYYLDNCNIPNLAIFQKNEINYFNVFGSYLLFIWCPWVQNLNSNSISNANSNPCSKSNQISIQSKIQIVIWILSQSPRPKPLFFSLGLQHSHPAHLPRPNSLSSLPRCSAMPRQGPSRAAPHHQRRFTRAHAMSRPRPARTRTIAITVHSRPIKWSIVTIVNPFTLHPNISSYLVLPSPFYNVNWTFSSL